MSNGLGAPVGGVVAAQGSERVRPVGAQGGAEEAVRLCANPDCRKPLAKRGGESHKDFATCKFCDITCRRAAEAAKRHQRVCPFCSEPFGPKANGEWATTCGEYACRRALLTKIADERSTGWPQITGEPDWGNGFRNNVAPAVEYGSLPMRPETHVFYQV